MIYFDTDVLIHLLITQDIDKHKQARALYQTATDKEQFFISLLCLQETAFVLHKLGQKQDDIEAMLDTFLTFSPVSYDIPEMKRGIALGKLIGFQNINDCIHTAIAEVHCTEMYTFNKADFKRIRKYTKLKITILD